MARRTHRMGRRRKAVGVGPTKRHNKSFGSKLKYAWQNTRKALDETIKLGRKGITFMQRALPIAGDIVGDVKSAIEESELPESEKRDFIGKVDKGAEAIEKVGEYTDKAESVLDDAEAVALFMQSGTIEQSDMIRMVNYLAERRGYDKDKARSIVQFAYKHGGKYKQQLLEIVSNPSGLAPANYSMIEPLHDSANHDLKKNPYYEGGLHTFPPHGNVFGVGHRSTLDSAYGSRNVFANELKDEVHDTEADSSKHYIKEDSELSRMQQLERAVMQTNEDFFKDSISY